MKKFGSMILAAVLGSGITIGVSEFGKENRSLKPQELITPIPTQKVSYNVPAIEPSFDFTIAAKQAMPAVVHIRSTQEVNYDQRLDQIPEQWRDFFGPLLRNRGDANPMPRMGSGSGVIINSEGHIVTNNHVIKDADNIEVVLSDNRSYSAKVIGTDIQTDIALLKIDEKNLPHLKMVNSDEVQVGEWVLAVGNPFNLTSTATAGIVSAKGRSINILTDSLAIESFIQTDAAVNPGNSGGALVNMDGNLIGINTAIASPTGAFSGYAFAVPTNIVSRVIEDLMTYGTVQRGLLGVQINNINSEFANEYGLSVSRGAYVAGFGNSSAAQEAGIKKGDVITKIDGRTIRTSADLIGLIGTRRPGDVVNVTVNRNGKELAYDVRLRNSQGTVELIKKEKEEFLTVLGAELENVDKQTLNKLGLKNGVRVRKLMPGKLRQDTDMRENFIITKIDDKPVSTKEEVVKILKSKSGGILIEGRYEGSSKPFYYGLGL